nr:hypothetical protein [Kofleriaceae bacterium]
MSTAKRGALSTGAAIGAVASVVSKRFLRGATLWIGVALALLPIAQAALIASKVRVVDVLLKINLWKLAGAHPRPTDLSWLSGTFGFEMVVLGIVSALVVAWPVGQDIEDRTATYLWSRPLARWTILVGKLAVLVPIVLVIFLGSWTAITVLAKVTPTPAPFIGLAAAVIAASFVASALALALPKHPLVLALLVLALLDPVVGAMNGGIALVTVSYNARVIGGFEDADVVTSVIALIIVAGVWLTLALRRIAKTEV